MSSAGLKPVMVFLYGGGKCRTCEAMSACKAENQRVLLSIGFDRGSINNPAYNGAYLAAAQDVVVVTFK